MKISNRIILLGCVMLLSMVSCAQTTKSKRLSSIYSEYKRSKSKQSEKDFFKEFPNSFKEFQSVYGYDDVKGESPNYKVAFDHVNFFFKSAPLVNKNEFSRKLINITLHGKWEADAENYFQDNLRNYYFANSTAILDILKASKLTDADQFWYFFCDGPSFDSTLEAKVKKSLTNYPQLKKSFVRMAQLAKKNSKE